MNGGHWEDEYFTMIRLEWSAASGEAPKRVDDGGDGWREKEGAGEGKSDQNVTKIKIWRYLRAR